MKIEDTNKNILLPHTYVTGDIISQVIQLLRVTFNADITPSSFYELLISNDWSRTKKVFVSSTEDKHTSISTRNIIKPNINSEKLIIPIFLRKNYIYHWMMCVRFSSINELGNFDWNFYTIDSLNNPSFHD